MAATNSPPIAGKARELLPRRLGLSSGATLVAGGIIGTSIFLVPSAVADTTGHPMLALGVWLLAGILAACAAVSFAELGAAIPETGGTYVHLKRAWRSNFVAFGFGWMMLFGYGSAAVAVVAIMASSYLMPLIQEGPVHPFHQSLCAMVIIAGITVLNVIGIRQGGGAQIVLTLSKIALILVLVAVPIGAGVVEPARFVSMPVDSTPAALAVSVAEGLILCLFAYSGSHFVTQVAGEVKNPRRDIPRAIFLGFSAVFVLYLTLNFVYLAGMPFAELRSSEAVAADLMHAAIGNRGTALVSIAIIVSALAVLNAQLMSYPRIVFALGRDGLLPNFIGSVHSRTRTPWIAVLIVALCAMFYVASGSYRDILGAVAFISHFFMTLAVGGLILLRVREPDLPRPYKVRPYPAAPLMFVLISIPYLGLLIAAKPLQTLTGVLIVALGAPVYLYRKKLVAAGDGPKRLLNEGGEAR